MFGIGGISKYLIGGLGLALVIALGGSYLVVKMKNNQIAVLNQDVATATANNATLKATIGEQNNSITRLEETRAKDQEKILLLAQKSHEAAREVEDLKSKFRRHDLNHLSLRKPGLIENIINKGTKKVHRELENLTDPQGGG